MPASGATRPGRRWLGWVSLVGLAALAAYAYLHSPAFRLQEIVVEGQERLTPEQVKWAAGVTPGELRWLHPAEEVRSRLLAAGLGLLDAQVEWRPGGVLVIRVVERQPVALVPYHNLFALVDGEGVVLGLGELSEWPYPVVTGVVVRHVLLGERIADPRLADALQAAQLLPDGLRTDLAEVHVDEQGELRLVFNGSLEARLGPPRSLADKIQSLTAVYADAQAGGYHIDVRNPRRPTLIPRTEAATGLGPAAGPVV